MNKHRWFAFAAVVVALTIAGWHVLCRPVVFVRDSQGAVLASVPADAGAIVSARFVHSAQKTPVIENYAVNENRDGLALVSTQYKSQGFGLPFLESDGKLRRDGDWLVVDIKRDIGTLKLRPGVINEYTLAIGGETLKLYELVPLGSLVTVSVEPRYKSIMN